MEANGNLKTLGNRRREILENLAFFTKFFTGFKEDPTLLDLVIVEIEERLPRFEALLHKFEDVQMQIELILAHLYAQDSGRKLFKEMSSNALKVLRSIMQQIEATNKYQARHHCLERHFVRINKKLQGITAKAGKEPNVMEVLEANQKLFLKAFETPTKIYKHLHNKHKVSPIFLNRTLRYMRSENRGKSSQNTFNVDSMMERLGQSSERGQQLTLSFLNFDKSNSANTIAVVNTYLIKFSSKKTRHSFGQNDEVFLGKSKVPVQSSSGSISGDNVVIPMSRRNQPSILLFKVKLEDSEPATKIRKLRERNCGESPNSFQAELVLIDNDSQCCLNDGEYEVPVHNISSREDILVSGTDEDFKTSTLRVKVQRCIPKPKRKSIAKQKDQMEILYNFIYTGIQQKTEAAATLNCPWCNLNCFELYKLLKHLSLCHSRFIFTYDKTPKGANIEVSINEMFDDSYDLVLHPYQFGTRPAKRISFTQILVCRPKFEAPNLEEFIKPKTEAGTVKVCNGHNRRYYHSSTTLPKHSEEIDEDSEEELDPNWLKGQTTRMVDDFSDVNHGEKEIMKMWNLHVMKYGFVGECHMPLACLMFVEEHGVELVAKNLYRNFLIHLCNLYDFNLINCTAYYKIIRNLQSIASSKGSKDDVFNIYDEYITVAIKD